jgi:hypothetical protein
MTNVYSTACTPWFIAAQQAVPAGGAPVNLLGGTLKVGDGNGVVPTISQLIANGGVLRQVWAGAPNSVTVDASNTGQIDVGCLIPTVDGSGAEIGPFNVTEFAIYDATGNLAIVGTTNLQKTTSAQGQLMTLQWYACYIAAAANAVTLQPPAGSFPTLGQVQSGVAGLLSSVSPIAITSAVQASGWTDFTIAIAPATILLHGVDTGTATAVNVAALTPAEAAFVAGQVFVITKSTTAISGPATATILGIEGSLIWADGTALANGDWRALTPALILWDGTAYRILSVMGPSVFARASAAAPLIGVTLSAPISVSNGVYTLINTLAGVSNSALTVGSSGITAVVAGTYQINMSLAGAVTTSGSAYPFVDLSINKNGVGQASMSTTGTTGGAVSNYTMVASTSTLVHLSVGDVVSLTGTAGCGSYFSSAQLSSLSFSMYRVGP